jgi:hypothetical protein
MEMYSSCKLAVSTDKLMAISDLAQDQQNDIDGKLSSWIMEDGT